MENNINLFTAIFYRTGSVVVSLGKRKNNTNFNLSYGLQHY